MGGLPWNAGTGLPQLVARWSRRQAVPSLILGGHHPFSFYFLFPTFSLHPYLLTFWQRLAGRPFLDRSLEWVYSVFSVFILFDPFLTPRVATTVGGSSPGLGPGRHPQGGGVGGTQGREGEGVGSAG